MNKEIWRDVKGYEGLYKVSSEGRVKSLERKDCLGRTIQERILKPVVRNDGYVGVNLYSGGKSKTLKVHRLVCEAFHDNPENKPCVNHIDENKTNNAASNLEWCTYEENNNHGTHNERVAKTLGKPIGQYKLDGQLIKVWPSTAVVERQTGFGQGCIWGVANGKYKQAYGYIWKYV